MCIDRYLCLTLVNCYSRTWAFESVCTSETTTVLGLDSAFKCLPCRVEVPSFVLHDDRVCVAHTNHSLGASKLCADSQRNWNNKRNCHQVLRSEPLCLSGFAESVSKWGDGKKVNSCRENNWRQVCVCVILLMLCMAC